MAMYTSALVPSPVLHSKFDEVLNASGLLAHSIKSFAQFREKNRVINLVQLWHHSVYDF